MNTFMIGHLCFSNVHKYVVVYNACQLVFDENPVINSFGLMTLFIWMMALIMNVPNDLLLVLNVVFKLDGCIMGSLCVTWLGVLETCILSWNIVNNWWIHSSIFDGKLSTT